MSTTTLDPVEYLYGTLVYFNDENEWVRRVISHRITKRTAKRIYYRRARTGRVGFVDRATLEAEDVVTNRGRGHWEDDHQLYATHGAALAAITPDPGPTLQELRREMADAHPDRGGEHETFLAARARYETAKRHLATTDMSEAADDAA